MHTHEDYRREVTAKGSSDRAFGFWIAAVLAVVAVLPLRHGRPVRWWFLAAAAALALTAALRPGTLLYPNRIWTRFGVLLGRVTQPVIMTILFFGVFTPIGLILRAVRKTSIRSFRDASVDSYWITRRVQNPAAETMRNQF